MGTNRLNAIESTFFCLVHLGSSDHLAVARLQDPGSEQLLQQYQKQRLPDQHQVALLTDGLVRLFGNPLRGLSMGRNLGMLAADLLPGVRHRIACHAMGLGGVQSRLARGLPLEY